MLRGFILGFHVLLALMIVALVLLQRGKGAEAGAGFGSGASGTVFGARGTSTLFSKLTAVFAALFFVTSLSLAYLGTRGPGEPTSVLERSVLSTPAPAQTTAQPPALEPAAPEPAAPAAQPATPQPAAPQPAAPK
ncbi:MAG TPA: preprotein translocase subunit SecG [Steroidobacteraceae bacterium]|nr:preprotein translocase subunit SecG [Steroidobacteraceae bacterium]